MRKHILIFCILLIISPFCFSENIKSIKIELKTVGADEKTKLIYDSESDTGSYPFLLFCDCLNGWGRKGSLKKLNPLFVPKSIQPEGSYIIYVKNAQNDLTREYRLLNFKAMQDMKTGDYYETDFLQYLYGYIA